MKNQLSVIPETIGIRAWPLLITLAALAIAGGCGGVSDTPPWNGTISGLHPADGAAVSDPTPVLSWNAVEDASMYHAQVAASEEELEGNAETMLLPEASLILPEPLANRQTHYWRVRAVDGYGQAGPWSTVHSLEVNTFIRVEGGTFTMGSPVAETGRQDDETQHEVTISTFSISRYEVTHREFIEFMNGAGVSTDGELSGYSVFTKISTSTAISYSDGRFFFLGNPTAPSIECPIVGVTWYGAVLYANWLSTRDALNPVYEIGEAGVTAEWNNSGYRLPSEAEWEYAARGGNQSLGYTYSGSNTADDVAWSEDNSRGSVHKVGAKNPNELGLNDMSGNVWELCWDWYSEYSEVAKTDPRGPDTGSKRILRGGSYISSLKYGRSAQRDSGYPNRLYADLGFRLALSHSGMPGE